MTSSEARELIEAFDNWTWQYRWWSVIAVVAAMSGRFIP